MTLDVHIVSHTHWDREWYHPLERFRQRLVALIDELLDDPPRKPESFLLDGQAIVLEDYVDVEWERSNELTSLLQTGRLEAGPWYVLADELIPSGEALVRNLLAGRRSLLHRGGGATSPPVLYCPDSFGHPAALPAIAAGFGFPVIILWRGYGGARWPSGDTARWVAPNGDSAILYHLPRDGYEFGSHLPSDEAAARSRWSRMRAELSPRSTTGVVLVPHGADHHARQRDDRAALDALVAAAGDERVNTSSLTAFANALRRQAEETVLPVVRGELRDSYGYTWTLQGTLATRAHEKRLNAQVERLLVRDAEPWSAMAASIGRSARRLVEKAWTTVLAAHPHDTLCGCSIDEVADAMELRLRSARNQASGIRDDSIMALIAHDQVEARSSKERWTPIVVIRNPAPRARSGVAIIDVEKFVADVDVGPGSAPKDPPSATVSKAKPRIAGLGPLQVLAKGLVYSRTESPRHYPDNDLVSMTRVAAWVEEMPAYGIVSRAIGGRNAKSACPDAVLVAKSSLKNANLSLSVDDAGSVALETGDRRIASLFEIIDETDVGDLYTPAPRPKEYGVQFRGTRVVHRGPLRGELALAYRVLSAQPRTVSAEISIHLVLDAAADVVQIEVRGTNSIANRRLRLSLFGGVRGGRIFADAAFGPVERRPIVVSPSEAAVERPPATAPLHRYVSRFADDRGFTIFSDGLAEYEARDDGSIAVTLVRGVGELSRNDLPERPGHAGWPMPTPRAQCIGPFEARFGVLLHAGRTHETIDRIQRTADDVLDPIAGVTLRSALNVPAPVHGLQLDGAGLAFSAMKESEDGNWTVLRCVNLTESPVAGRWTLGVELTDARLARLDETIIGGLDVLGPSVAFEAGPRAIVTILVR